MRVQPLGLSKLVFLAYAALVTYLSVRPMGDTSLGSWDKLAHLVIYAIFVLLAARVARSRRQLTFLSIGIIAYSGLLELVQSQLPGRFMSGYDLAANIVGAAMGFALVSVFDPVAREAPDQQS